MAVYVVDYLQVKFHILGKVLIMGDYVLADFFCADEEGLGGVADWLFCAEIQKDAFCVLVYAAV